MLHLIIESSLCLDPDNERSPSFKNLIKGNRRMESELLALPKA